MKRQLFFSGLTALFVTLATIGIYHAVSNNRQSVTIEHINQTPAQAAVWQLDENGEPVPLDFTKVAENVVDAVVHIKATKSAREARAQRQMPREMDPFREFFGPDRFFRFEQPSPSRPQVGTGSGVIINDSGYIVTNNHVIEGAEDIEVALTDNRTFKATIVGTDPSTDLALLQIKAEGLPTLKLLDSDKVRVGEWVMAVGNPLGLNSTITAGIVSAKGRNINILKENFAVESFIQTDAAINPGNSGGALVNLNGGLVGINTAIASPTGAYAGYGFAVPSNIVGKVVEDLLQFGSVQRGVLGVMIRSVDGNLAKQESLSTTTGVYVDSLLENSAAGVAGIKPGDVITAVDGETVSNSSELQERIARYRPGDEVTLEVLREDEKQRIAVELRSRYGNKVLAKGEKPHTVLRKLGADLETLSPKEAEALGLDGGVRVKALYNGKIRQFTNMQEGFIITKVDGKPVRDKDRLIELLEDKPVGGLLLEGIYEDVPGERYYAFGW